MVPRGGEGFYQIHDVTAGGPGLVAGGLHDSGVREREDQGGFLFLDLFEGINLNFDAVVWTSPDGITWSRVPGNR